MSQNNVVKIEDLLRLLKELELVAEKNYAETDEKKQNLAINSFKNINKDYSSLLDKSDLNKKMSELFWLFDGARNSFAVSLTIGFDTDSKKKLFNQGKDKLNKISKILKTIKNS